VSTAAVLDRPPAATIGADETPVEVVETPPQRLTGITGRSAADAVIDDLASRARRGDVEAFGHIYELLADKVRLVALCHGVDTLAAADVTHETFLHAWQGRDRYPGEYPYRSWLMGIARHMALRHHRAERRSRSRHVFLDSPPAVETRDAAQIVVDRLEREHVWRAVDALPASVRLAVFLRYGRDLSLAEIAAASAASEGTVKYALSRGLHSLREQFGTTGRRNWRAGRSTGVPVRRNPHFAHFARWCSRHGVEALPASPETVLAYLVAQVGSGRAFLTLRARAGGIAATHRAAGHPSPTSHPNVRDLLVHRQRVWLAARAAEEQGAAALVAA
jgi:RNA polymerase sigma-70 factor, ECF subfamily